MSEARRYLLAIVLSIFVVVGWTYVTTYFGISPSGDQQAVQEETPQRGSQIPGKEMSSLPSAGGGRQVGTALLSSAEVLKESKRVPIRSGKLSGSINLTGARIDDLRLMAYRETVDPKSPVITLFSPEGTPRAYFAEFGWVSEAAANQSLSLPTARTVWTQEGTGALTPETPVRLRWDNGAGVVFARVFSLDKNYLLTVRQSVENKSADLLRLYPYGLVARFGIPELQNVFILHEGMIGVLGEEGLQEMTYAQLKEARVFQPAPVEEGWLGITDKYWAATVIPEQNGSFTPRFVYEAQSDLFQADYLGAAVSLAPGEKISYTTRLFAGAKEVSLIDAYQSSLKLSNFDLLIDWGWFYFITKPMFFLIDWFYKFFGNFGIAILLSTVVIKLLLFPLASRSYSSMNKMKLVQPEMMALRNRYKEDKARQQKAIMDLYRREKINPLAGCLPILIQIPIFFALYKVLYISLEMRHAPFFGWIKDLAAPDPTTIFNLFGLFPWTPPSFLMLGVWPLVMGITMFLQMKMNPEPTDPAQRIVFTWMPVLFTFMLASFPAGLVIYWAWNNILSILQQYIIMLRQGIKVELWGNLARSLRFLRRRTPVSAREQGK